jgi:hypothetical protein
MTTISLVAVSRHGQTVNAGAIKVGRFSRRNNRSKGPTPLREQPRVGALMRPQEFASGFVDLLLGRTSRVSP